MTLIEAKTLGSNTTTVSFASIPATYTDLKILISARTTRIGPAENVYIGFNGSTSSFTTKQIVGEGSGTPQSYSFNRLIGVAPGATGTANTFTNFEVYISNYASSNFKSFSADAVQEANQTLAYTIFMSGLWSDNTAINSVEFTAEFTQFVTGSTFYLYGIANAAIFPNAKATGGTIYQDDTYFYHVFGSSGVFTPTQSLSCDTLVIAGGGGGARTGGGGGAGGLRGLTSQSMTAQAYTITVGGGGAGSNTDFAQAGDGTTSSIAGSGFSTINTTGGGGAASYGATTGRSGGSGGGGSAGIPDSTGGAGNAGGYTPVEGYAGGQGSNDGTRGGGGGGGGASQAGQATTTGAVRIGGNGGNGSSAFSSWGVATGTGQNVNGTYWYAGGGGAASDTASLRGLGGLGGGGNAGTNTNPSDSVPGMANTGGGGGANSGNYPAGANGGSGLVILRYAK